MNERIKKLRKALNLTQQEFADRLGTTRNNIAGYETGRRAPSVAVISLICREFNISETWLRTGAGEMIVQRSRENEIEAFMEHLLQNEDADFVRRFVAAISRLNTSQLELLESVALGLINEFPNSSSSTPAEMDTRPREEKPVMEWTEADIDADVEEYRQSLLEEKRRARSGSASAGPSSNGTA